MQEPQRTNITRDLVNQLLDEQFLKEIKPAKEIYTVTKRGWELIEVPLVKLSGKWIYSISPLFKDV